MAKRVPVERRIKRIRGTTLINRKAAHFREHPLCVICLNKTPSRVTLATIYDHIVPLDFGGTNDGANMQGLCRECHDIKSAEERGKCALKHDAPGCTLTGQPLDPNHHWNKKKCSR